jgi:hypothetical protein
VGVPRRKRSLVSPAAWLIIDECSWRSLLQDLPAKTLLDGWRNIAITLIDRFEGVQSTIKTSSKVIESGAMLHRF